MAVYVTKETDIVLKFESVQMTTLFGLVVAVARHATAGRSWGYPPEVKAADVFL